MRDRPARERRDGAPALLLAFVVYLLITAILIGVRQDITVWIPWGLFAITVIATSWDVAIGWAVYNGVTAFLFFDFFFTEPYGKLHMSHSLERHAAVALIAGSIAVSLLARAVHGPTRAPEGSSAHPPKESTWQT